jgi:hypothetical protein
LVQRSLCAVLSSALRSSRTRTQVSGGLNPKTISTQKLRSLLQSLTRSERHRTRQQLALLGFAPLRRISPEGTVHSGLPHPTPSGSRVSHPLAVFLPSAPPAMFQARTPMGFSLQGLFPLPSLSDPLESGPLPDVGRSDPGLRRAHHHFSPDFKALLSTKIRHFWHQGKLVPQAAALLGFDLLGVSLSTPPAAHATDSLLSFTAPCRSKLFPPGPKTQSFLPRSTGRCLFRAYTTPSLALSLTRLPPLVGFLHLLSALAVQCSNLPGLWIHPDLQVLLPVLETSVRQA